ncbi:MAG: Calx-beta domain-containing protein [Caldilineaceae bacterium]
MGGNATRTAQAQQFPPPGAGYLDYTYGPDVAGAGRTPTESMTESKLWWNDGFWWGSMWNPAAKQYHIYRLNWGAQIWEDTGAPIDDRQDSRGDTLWDGTKLYIASHFAVLNAANTSNPANYARLYRYSYNAANHIYSLDAGFPVNINHDKTEALTLAKDSTGRLWITYISRDVQTNPNFYKVYVNATMGADTVWGTPIGLTELQTPGAFATEGQTTLDDLSAIIAFKDNGGSKVGILWSTQYTGTNHINFAWHLDSNSSYTNGADWTLQKGLNALAGTNPVSNANSHMNIKALRTATSGQVFAAIKFENQLQNPPQPTFPELGLLARDVDGTFVYRTYSTVADNDSHPLLLLNEGDPTNANDNAVNLFVSDLPQGSKICYKALSLPASPASLSTLGLFPTGDCGANFIVDTSGGYATFRDPSSTKQNVNNTTGIVVLASDVNGQAYAHNIMGNPPPVVTAYSPSGSPVAATGIVTVVFSKPIDSSTLTNLSFQVTDGVTTVPGVLSYDSTTRTATFTPDSPLKANTPYTVKLTNAIKDRTNLALDAFKSTLSNTVVEQWTFTTGSTTVQFAQPAFSVLENGGSAIIAVTLAAASAQPVTVNYATSNGTASAPSDYVATNGTLTFNPGELSKTFNVPIIDNNVQNSNKTVNLALNAPSGAGLGALAMATLTIIDNDGPPAVQFSLTSNIVNENAGSALITVILSQPTNTPVTVHYTTSDGTALAGQDYSAVSDSILTFAAGVTQVTLSVPILDDNMHEADETFRINLSNISGGAVLGTPGDQAIVTIKDNDVNIPPVANNQNVATLQNTPVGIVLTASDTNNDPLNYSIVGKPNHGALSGSPPNLTYTPAAGFSGIDSFAFKANDGQVDSNVAMVTITIANPGDTPTFTPTPTSLPGDTPTFTPTPTTGSNGDSHILLPVVVKALPPTATATAIPGPSWQRIGQPGLNVAALAIQGDQLVVGERRDANHPGGLYQRSLAACAATPHLTHILPIASSVLGVAFQGTKGVAAAYDLGMFYTNDGGASWRQSSDQVNNPRTVLISPGVIYAGTENAGIYFSQNDGVTWTQRSGEPQATNVLAVSPSIVWVGANTTGVWKLLPSLPPAQQNNGLNNPASQAIWDLEFHDNLLYLATADGVYRGDGGANSAWQPFDLQLKELRSLEIVGDQLYVGVLNGGVWQHSLTGGAWQRVTSANWNDTYTVRALLYDASNCQGLLAATNDGVWLYR